MIGIYFSGTGNSRYVLECFFQEYDKTVEIFSIEDENIIDKIKENEEIVFSYPVQYSNIPKILKDFIDIHSDLWKSKKIFVIATMGLFSGDGAGILARLLYKHGAEIIGGLHLKMPDSIADERALKHSLEKNKELVKQAQRKIKNAVRHIKSDRPPQDGIGLLCQIAGLFGQRLYFYNKMKKYTNKLKIDKEKCIGCGICVRLCPMKNLSLNDHLAKAENRCTMCYRCINTCPQQAITLLGKHVVEQGTIDKYL